MKKKIKFGKICIHALLILLSLTFVIPIVIVISMSLSSEEVIARQGYSVFPKAIDFSAYQYVFKNPAIILDAYKVTVLISVVGTLVSVLIMMMCAYSLSRRSFKLRSAINFYLFFTLLFNGGMVPRYIVVTQYLHLQDTLWILILNLLVNVWYVYIFRTFMKDIPESVIESAMLDSAGEFTIFFRIVAPLCKPAIATVGLFVLLNYWNEWTTALLYIDDEKKYPLQYLLQKILQNIQNVMMNMNRTPIGSAEATKMPTETVRMALAVVATGPMLVIMPFFQKYFVRGMTLGSVKG